MIQLYQKEQIELGSIFNNLLFKTNEYSNFEFRIIPVISNSDIEVLQKIKSCSSRLEWLKDNNYKFSFHSQDDKVSNTELLKHSTLLNASKVTNFTYKIIGPAIADDIVAQINSEKLFSKKIVLIEAQGCQLKFEKVENEIFRSNLQTIDYKFEKILSDIILLFYKNNDSKENSIAKFTEKVALKNPIGYNLSINSKMYEMVVKKFLKDYALGMRAAEVWQRDYQALGGYLVVKEDGDILCYHFYFIKNFEDYLFYNTKLETPSVTRHGFGKIYSEDNLQKIKLNLQIRFIK
jgi:type II restriction enzyme